MSTSPRYYGLITYGSSQYICPVRKVPDGTYEGDGKWIPVGDNIPQDIHDWSAHFIFSTPQQVMDAWRSHMERRVQQETDIINVATENRHCLRRQLERFNPKVIR